MAKALGLSSEEWGIDPQTLRLYAFNFIALSNYQNILWLWAPPGDTFYPFQIPKNHRDRIESKQFSAEWMQFLWPLEMVDKSKKVASTYICSKFQFFMIWWWIWFLNLSTNARPKQNQILEQLKTSSMQWMRIKIWGAFHHLSATKYMKEMDYISKSKILTYIIDISNTYINEYMI